MADVQFTSSDFAKRACLKLHQTPFQGAPVDVQLKTVAELNPTQRQIQQQLGLKALQQLPQHQQQQVFYMHTCTLHKEEH